MLPLKEIISGLLLIRREHEKENGLIDLSEPVGARTTTTDTEVIDDAIRRINDQIPRVLALDEIPVGRLVFVEMASISPDYGYCERIPPKGNGTFSCWFKGCGCIAALPIETYGSYWWAWTAKPTPRDKEFRNALVEPEPELTREQARRKGPLWWEGYRAGADGKEYQKDMPPEWRRGYKQAANYPFDGAI